MLPSRSGPLFALQLSLPWPSVQHTSSMMLLGQAASQQLPALQQQQPPQHQQLAGCSSSTTPNTSGSSSSSRNVRRQKQRAYEARLPRVRKYGPALRDLDPAAFDQMRLVLGYYDLPQHRHKPRPPPPTHVTINNLQSLKHSPDVDPYYKLALLSYRSKLQNTQLLQGLAGARSFLQQVSLAALDFVPGDVAALGATGQQQQQQQQQQPAATGAAGAEAEQQQKGTGSS